MRSDPFDFRFGNYLVGSAEAAVLNMVSARLYEHLFGVPRGYTSLLSMARWPDAQAVHDHALSAYLGAMWGATSYGNSGQLGHDEVFSPEIVVIDRDIVRSAERFVKGVEWEGGERGIERSLEIIREGLESSSFLDHDTTVAECRNFFFAGDLLKGMNLGQWRQAGSVPLIEEAARQVDELVAGNEFRRPDDQVRELRRICDRAAAG
jgi:trimethylamine:corrinoid methyltransferase-like protein